MECPVWFPLLEGLNGICELLTEQQKPCSDHTQIYRKLEEYSASPEFSNYLVYLFAEGENFPVEIRQSAGLLLKNKLKSQFCALPEANRGYIETLVIKALTLSSSVLRQTASVIVSCIVSLTGILSWSELIHFLSNGLGSDHHLVKEAALDTILKICEDSPGAFDAAFLCEGNGSGSGFEIIQQIQHQLIVPHNSIKKLSLSIMNMIIMKIPPSQARLWETYHEALLHLMSDPEASIQKEVCYGLTQLLLFHESVLSSTLDRVIEHMLQCTKHPDHAVSMEATEFWTTFVDSAFEPHCLRPYLKLLIPIFLTNMVYEEDDEAIIQTRQAEEDRKDSDSEIGPFHISHDSDLDDGEDQGVEGSWTLRKCSAAGLDKLSLIFGDELLPEILPLVNQTLQNPDWRVRESGILVLGAISDGCRSGLDPELGTVLSYVLEKANDPEPMVRIISCWVLSRYTERIIMLSPEPSSKTTSIFQAIFRCLKDRNKQVQESACSALACIMEIGGEAILSRLTMILQQLADACWMYGQKNLRFVYDAISTLASKVGCPMSELKYREIIMKPLFTHFEKFSSNDKALQPLLNCFASLAGSFGAAFEEYTIPLYTRCVQILGQNEKAEEIPGLVVCCLELISSLIESLGSSMESLISESKLLDFLAVCCQSKEEEIRQSAFALVGELSKSLPNQITPHLNKFLCLAVHGFATEVLNESSLSACNNACWSLGELSLRSKEEDVKPLASKALENCVSLIMQAYQLPRILVENAAITLGRMAILCSNEFSQHLHIFLAAWCEMLRNVRDDDEKEQAFIGLLKTIQHNPDVASNCFPSICAAVASWSFGMSPHLKEDINSVLQVLKQILEARGEWENILTLVPSSVREKLEKPGVL